MEFPMWSQMPMIPQDSHVSSDSNGGFLSRHPGSAAQWGEPQFMNPLRSWLYVVLRWHNTGPPLRWSNGEGRMRHDFWSYMYTTRK